MNTIKYSKLTTNAKSPFRKNPTDAGADFYSIENITIDPHSMKIVHTGISVEIPKDYVFILKPKSKNNHLIGAGVIDSFYDGGEILIKVTNITDSPLEIKEGDAIAQGLYIPIATPEFEEVPIEQLKNNSKRSGIGGIVTQDREKEILKELGF